MKSHLLVLCCSFVFACSNSSNNSDLKYYGSDNREVEIKYETWFEIGNSDLDMSSIEQESFLTNNKKVLDERLKLQVLFLYGTFTQHTSPTDFYSWPATIRETQKTNISKIEFESDRVKVFYSYKDIGVAYVALMDGERQKNIPFYLPNNPDTIYELSMPKNPKIDPKSKKPVHPCTDRHDFSEAAFWYYWNPSNRGCPRKIKGLIHEVSATFKLKPQTKKTYPEYDRLSDEWQNGNTYSFYFGIDKSLSNPKDLGRKTFEDFNNNLEKNGAIFKLIGSKKNEVLFEAQDAMGRGIQIRSVLGDTDAKGHDEVAREMMLNSSLFIFAGHSYEGFYFNPDRLFPDRDFKNDKYQIIMMNSCSSYSYYHSNLFNAKSTKADRNGTKNLDIVTNAIGSPILADTSLTRKSTLYGAEFVLLMEILGYDKNGQKRANLSSWQTIMQEIENDVGYELSSLSQVLGDHDNEFNP